MDGINNLMISENTPIIDILKIFEDAKFKGLPKGIAVVVDDKKKLVGTITDGDIRRSIINSGLDNVAKEMMQVDPITFPEHYSIQEINDQLPLELEKRGRKSKNFLSKIVVVNDINQPVKVLEFHQLWEQRVATHRNIVVVGLGYVGLTMALVMADRGFNILGVDIDAQKVAMLNSGQSYVHEVGLPELLRETVNKNFNAYTEIPEGGDVYIISVGTPVIQKNDGKLPAPILNYLDKSLEMIAKKLKPGNLVVLRSTVPVATCREFVIPRLEELTGMRCGFDFHLSFAPERTAEGKAIKELRELPQIIGGYNQDSVESTAAIFRELTSTIVRVDSLEAAEMAKLINNSFRDYVFAYSNFVSQLASKFNINIFDVINAANKGYPRDKVPLPSPGVGGPCLTKDPYIFSSVTAKNGIEDYVFKDSRRINENMLPFTVDRLENELTQVGKKLNESQVLVCGLAFKGNPETGDIRNSTSVEILQLIEARGAKVYGYDPVSTDEEISEFNIKAVGIPHGFVGKDAVLFLNNHKSFEKIDVFKMVRSMNESPIILDGWNIFHDEDILNAKPSIYMSLSHSVKSIDK
ncbi:MAG: nucleotide sugar dehydrogenase [Bacteroidia bacterium]